MKIYVGKSLKTHERTKKGQRTKVRDRRYKNFINFEFSISPSSERVRKSSAALGASEIVFLIDW